MFKYILLLMLPVALNCASINVTIKGEVHFISKILELFHRYHKVWHIDDNKKFRRSIPLQQFYSHGPVHIINYDKIENPIRPSNTGKALHLINLSNITRLSSYLSNVNNFHSSDIFLIPLSNKSLQTGDYFYLKYLERSRLTLISNRINSKWIFYNICYDCGIRSGRLNYILTTDFDGTNITDISNFWREQFNLGGQHFKVAYVDYMPFIYSNKKDNSIQYEGVHATMIETLSQKMNFTFTLIQHNSSYNNVFRLLNQGVYDFAIGGFQITTEHLNMVPMTECFHWENILVAYFHRKTLLDTVKAYFHFLPLRYWCAVIGSLIASAVGFYLIGKFDGRIKEKLPYPLCLDMFFKACVEQPINLKHYYNFNCLKRSLIFSVWLVVLLQINTAFKSKIAAIMMNPTMADSKILDDLISEGYGFIQEQIVKDNNLLPANKQITIYNEAIPNLCPYFMMAWSGKYALILEEASIRYQIDYDCYFKSNIKWGPQYYMNSKYFMIPFSSVMHGLPIKKASPIGREFSFQIKRYFENGLLEHWRDVWDNNFTVFLRRIDIAAKVNLIDWYRLQLIMYFVGISVSILCFTLEILVWQLYGKKQMYKNV